MLILFEATIQWKCISKMLVVVCLWHSNTILRIAFLTHALDYRFPNYSFNKVMPTPLIEFRITIICQKDSLVLLRTFLISDPPFLSYWNFRMARLFDIEWSTFLISWSLFSSPLEWSPNRNMPSRKSVYALQIIQILFQPPYGISIPSFPKISVCIHISLLKEGLLEGFNCKAI